MNELSIVELESIGTQLLPLAREAGQVLAALYKTDVRILAKPDGSPVTEADQKSHDIIVEGLQRITPSIQVISEEGDILKPHGDTYWLVDPLDGTKGFINHTGQFCINIALVEKHHPTLGCIHAPLTGETILGYGGAAGFWTDASGTKQPLRPHPVSEEGYRVLVGARSKVKGSRQNVLLDQFNCSTIRAMGSALKFLELGKGNADLYIRLLGSYEWDTAAGQAIVEACGGHVLNLDKTPLTYGKPNLLNSSFIAICDDNFNWS